MQYTLSGAGLEFEGHNYPFVKPQDFDSWLKTKQDAFIQGYLHAYKGTPQEQQVIPTQEEVLL